MNTQNNYLEFVASYVFYKYYSQLSLIRTLRGFEFCSNYKSSNYTSFYREFLLQGTEQSSSN